MRTLGYAFCQPPIKSIPKSFYPRKVTTKFLSQKSPWIPNFNPKKGLRRPLSLLYLSIPLGHDEPKECQRRTGADPGGGLGG